ncbi:MAG TPA: carboxypeptidase regulatory-like domain-containing protein, partial [Bryobacteraceae bacterium]|nr:carboxypeptidase regulatory-like domain-containing protein [Bryobacteraceae bacterium]
MKRPTVENLARTFVLMTIVAPLHGQGLGAVRGTVKDASSGVIVAAKVTLKETHTDWTQTTQSDSAGAFVINGIPLGEYTLRVEHEGFAPSTQPVQVLIGSAPSIDVRLEIGAAASSVTVNETASEVLAAEASAAPTLVSGDQIREGLPGAEQMSSLRFVTETAPGAFVLHDHLHVRGGHQIDWILNGVPIPNTNMSSNVGRTLDPKDIEEVEVSQGGFGAQSGDRTFAQINIFTRSGFEFHNDGDLTMTYGSFHQTND